MDDWSDFDDEPADSEEDYSVGEYLVTNKDDNIHKQRSTKKSDLYHVSP